MSTDLKDFLTVLSYLNGLVQSGKEIKESQKIKDFLMQQLNAKKQLQVLLQERGDPAMNEKYEMVPGCYYYMNHIYPLIRNIEQNEIGSREREDLQNVNLITGHAILSGIYEYFNKTTQENRTQITSLGDWVVSNKPTSYTQTYQVALGNIHSDLLLPESVYYSQCLINAFDHRGFDGSNLQKRLSVSRFANVFLVSFIYEPNRYDRPAEYDRELLKLIDSLIQEFIQYCPPIAIDLYLKTSINLITNELNSDKIKNIATQERDIIEKMCAAQSMLPLELVQIAQTNNR